MNRAPSAMAAMAEEPHPKCFKVSYAEADPKAVKINPDIQDENIQRLIAVVVGLPRDAQISLVELGSDAYVEISFSSLTHDCNYRVEHYPQKGPVQAPRPSSPFFCLLVLGFPTQLIHNSCPPLGFSR